MLTGDWSNTSKCSKFLIRSAPNWHWSKHHCYLEHWAPPAKAEIILCMCITNERQLYIVKSSLIGWAHTQNHPCKSSGSLFQQQNQLCLNYSKRVWYTQWLFHSWNEYGWIYYRKISNIRCTKFPNFNVSCLVLQLSLPNPMKPGVKSRMKM